MEDMLEAGLLVVHGVDPKESFPGRITTSGRFSSTIKSAFHLDRFWIRSANTWVDFRSQKRTAAETIPTETDSEILPSRTQQRHVCR